MAKKKAKGDAPAESAPKDAGSPLKELLRELWESAVNLRGSIEPADYKRYVLPLIFLRFLSLRYERRRAELEKLIADPASDYHTTDPKAAEAILNEPDEYRAGGAFIVPEPARWAKVIEAARKDDIRLHLDNVLELLESTYPDQLRGLLPRVYAASNLDAENLRQLINLFSKDVFSWENGAESLQQVFTHFIDLFAATEGKRAGDLWALPPSFRRFMVAMLEPTRGVLYDPCCGSGGMFVQSDTFTRHNHELSFFGQESKDFTYRLCRMNLFIHGIDGNIQLGNTYFNDKHETVKADYVLAAPPFNDGSKSAAGWGADRVPSNDPRLTLGAAKLPLSARNANTMWMMHFLHHLKPGGTAGFVMATGELSNGETARLEVRKALIENDLVDCVVQLTGQLFANTQIPCALWFLSKGRGGASGMRKRTGEILFIDGRKLGLLIPGSRKQKELSAAEVEQVASVYREFRRTGTPAEQLGFCKAATLDEVRGHKYALTPGRYVGSAEVDDDGEAFEEKLPRLTAQLTAQMQESAKLDAAIAGILAEIGNGTGGLTGGP